MQNAKCRHKRIEQFCGLPFAFCLLNYRATCSLAAFRLGRHAAMLPYTRASAALMTGMIYWCVRVVFVRWAPAVFAAAVITFAAFVSWSNRAKLTPSPTSLPTRVHSTVVAVACLAVALTAFQPIVRVGLLSDDFTLLQWARGMEFLPVDWEYLRPLPLFLWWAVDFLAPPGRTPVALHLLNITGHAVNSWLVWRLGTELGLARPTAVAAAAFFLAWPLAVEPVVWCSAVFDVVQAALALTLCIVVARRPDPSRAHQVVCVALALLMVATKETGVAAAPLALLVYWTRWGAGTRRGYINIGCIALVAVLYLGWRAWTGRIDPRLAPVLETQSIERLLTQSFGAMSLPLHEDVIRDYPAAALVARVGFVVLLVTWVCRWRRAPHGASIALLAAAALIVTVLPAVTPFGVLGDLQGSRYVYLGSAFWCIALGAALLDGWTTGAARAASVCVTGLAIAACVAANQLHFRPWREAARARQFVLTRLLSLPPTCVRVHVTGVPDNVSGAYVFRNGLGEAAAAFGRDYEFAGTEEAPPPCRIDVSREHP
jgi:hypothetical protein